MHLFTCTFCWTQFIFGKTPSKYTMDHPNFTISDGGIYLSKNLVRPKKNIELFLGHRRICFKSPALLFFLLLSKKEKEKKRFSNFLTSLSVTTMWFHTDVLVHNAINVG